MPTLRQNAIRSAFQSDLCKIRDGIATEDHMGVYHALGVCVENRIESHGDDDPDSHVIGFTTVSELNELKAALAWCSNKVMQDIEQYSEVLNQACDSMDGTAPAKRT